MQTSATYLNRLGDSMHFVADLPSEELAWAKRLVETVHLAKDEYFLRAGEVPQRIGFNLRGLLRLYYVDHHGTERTKHFCVEGTGAFSYSAFLQQTASRLSIQALEDSTLLVVDHDTYLTMRAHHPGWQIAARKLAELLFIIKEKREAELLLQSAAQRYAQFREDYPGLELRVNQYHIASYLGITPESLSRIRAGRGSHPRRRSKRPDEP